MKKTTYLSDEERIIVDYGYLFTSGKYQKLNESGKWKTLLRVPVITDLEYCADQVVKRLYDLKFATEKTVIKPLVLQSGLPERR